MRLSVPAQRRYFDGEVRVRLTDGGAVALRPLLHGELAPLDAVFSQMSAESRFSRYLAPMPHLPGSFRRALSDLDGRDRVAWLATAAGRPVGIGRYVRTAYDTADIAFEVVDDHQGRGIGSVLVEAVCTVATAYGVERVEAVVAPDNAPSIALLRRMGVRLVHDGGVLDGRGEIRLPVPARVDREAVLRLAARVARPSRSTDDRAAVAAGSPGPAHLGHGTCVTAPGSPRPGQRAWVSDQLASRSRARLDGEPGSAL